VGASAAALALKYPALVRGLVLASGYYYPTMRLEVVAMAAPAMPLFGDLIAYAMAPIVGRLIWPRILAKAFGPSRYRTNSQDSQKKWRFALRKSQHPPLKRL
jgi:pimeloyl-ACP methyl ester carboxylesterase